MDEGDTNFAATAAHYVGHHWHLARYAYQEPIRVAIMNGQQTTVLALFIIILLLRSHGAGKLTGSVQAIFS